MLPDTAIQEELSKAYLQTVACYAGYAVQHIDRDNDGVDALIKSNSKPAPDSLLASSSLEVQIKACCSEEHIFVNADGDIVYDLQARNYNILADTHRQLDIILVLLDLPPQKGNWITHNVNNLILRKCAYWISLKGQAQTTNANSKRIIIPHDNIFSPNALHEIMVKISKEEDL